MQQSISSKNLCTDPISDSQYPQLKAFSGEAPTLPAFWTCTAVLHPFSPVQSNSTPADIASPFFEICTASIAFAEGIGMNALLVGSSGRNWWYKITPTETSVSTDGKNYTQIDLGWILPTSNWFGSKSREAECIGTSYLNWMEAQEVDWWKIPVGNSSPSPATWMWFNHQTTLPVRLMFGQGPASPCKGDKNQLALFQMFSFIYFPDFNPSETNPLNNELLVPNIQGFNFGNVQNYQLFEWNNNFGMTVFMTPVNESFNPLPTRVLYNWKSDSDYQFQTDRSQNTLMKYTYNPSNSFTAQEALLTGKAPQGITPPYGSGTGFLINFDGDTITENIGFSNFPFGQEPPDWVKIPAVEGTIQATVVDNPTLCPGNPITIVSVLFPPSAPNYPDSTYLWTWYSPLDQTGSSSRPVTFMQSQSGVGVGTSLALADYFDYEEFTVPTDPCNFTIPPFISIQANVSWQTTGITLQPNQQAQISYVGGLWTANPHDNFGQLYDAKGNPSYINAKPGYTMPGEDEGALIGRVGDTIFFVGNGVTSPIGLSGPLELCINDDLKGKYGAGLKDNKGFVNVSIEVSEK